jgi:hypothetical protein
MSEKQGIKEGFPIWVESLMNAEEWRERHRKYPTTSTIKQSISYNPEYHKGGKWRAGMGKTLTSSEIDFTNKTIDKLREFLLEQKKKV